MSQAADRMYVGDAGEIPSSPPSLLPITGIIPQLESPQHTCLAEGIDDGRSSEMQPPLPRARHLVRVGALAAAGMLLSLALPSSSRAQAPQVEVENPPG